MKKRKIFIGITIAITLLLFAVMVLLPKTSLRGFVYSNLHIVSLLLLEAIVFYDIAQAMKNPDKKSNYIKITIFNIFIIIAIVSIMGDVSPFIFIIPFSVSIPRVVIIMISILDKRISSLKDTKSNNFKKILTLKINIKKIIIATISCLLLFMIIKSMIIVKIPYQVHCNTLLSGKLRVIQNMNELNELFNEDIISEQSLIFQQLEAQGKLEESKDLLKKEKEEAKQEVIEKFGIDNNFFNKYYLVFFSDASGNTAEPMGIDYITYNKINKQVKLVQEDAIVRGIGGDVSSHCSYFVKIDKKYFGEVGWKTKYKLFINDN